MSRNRSNSCFNLYHSGEIRIFRRSLRFHPLAAAVGVDVLSSLIVVSLVVVLCGAPQLQIAPTRQHGEGKALSSSAFLSFYVTPQ
ncbi:hypothetical protein AKJ16_DCAP24501 [Drosera capensis]